MENVANRTVIITGAGAGIGQALAAGFVGLGAHVVAVSRGATGLDETRRRCQGPGKLECHVIDVTQGGHLESLFAQVVQERGGVDVLVNGAAVYPRTLLAETTPEDWASGTATNLNGVAFVCRAAVRTFPGGRAAVVLNVGSFAHLGPEPRSTLYCATKAAVGAFSRALAVELAAAGSRLIVNEWVPGVYKTQMSAYSGEDPALAFERLLKVLAMSAQGPGGRTFEGDREVLPPRSRLSRLKALVLGRRA